MFIKLIASLNSFFGGITSLIDIQIPTGILESTNNVTENSIFEKF